MSWSVNLKYIKKPRKSPFLEKLVDRIWKEFKEEHFAGAIRLSQKGLVIASNINCKVWVRMFDALCKEMYEAYNIHTTPEGNLLASRVQTQPEIPERFEELKIRLF